MLFRTLVISLPVAALAIMLIFSPAGNLYAQDGMIQGVVEPPEANATVWVIEDAEVIARIDANNENGEFSKAVPAGIYQVYVEPQEEGYVIFEVPDVEVESGETVDLGTLNLEE